VFSILLMVEQPYSDAYRVRRLREIQFSDDKIGCAIDYSGDKPQLRTFSAEETRRELNRVRPLWEQQVNMALVSCGEQPRFAFKARSA